MIPMMSPLSDIDPIPTELKKVEKIPEPEVEEWVEDKNTPYLWHCGGKSKYAPPLDPAPLTPLEQAVADLAALFDPKHYQEWKSTVGDKLVMDPKIIESDRRAIEQQRALEWKYRRIYGAR